MPARQHDRYDVAAQRTDLRNVIAELILVVLVLGLALNLAGSVIFTTVDSRRPPLWLSLLAVAVLVIGSALALYWFWRRNDRLLTEEARIDLLVPYEINRQEGLFVPALLPQSPYSVISDARSFYESAYPTDERRALARAYETWRTEHPGAPFHDWADGLHHQMVEALLLNTIRFYNERALGTLSRTAWLRSPLPSELRELADFDERLRDNPFLRARARARNSWKIPMPVDVALVISETADGVEWELRHARHGSVLIVIEKRMSDKPWRAGRGGTEIRTLRIGLPDPAPDALCIALGSRIRARAQVRGVLGRKRDEADCFCSWATQLLSMLEQSLDWAYFDEERRPRQLMIRMNANLEDVQARLAALETRLDETIVRLDGAARGPGAEER